MVLTSSILLVQQHPGTRWIVNNVRGQTLMTLPNPNRRYPTVAKNTLEDVSIFCSLNSRVAVIGPNGAGKSTMIKVRAGAAAHSCDVSCGARLVMHTLGGTASTVKQPFEVTLHKRAA